MNRALIIAVLLLPLLAWGQVKPTASLPPEKSRVQLRRLGDSLRKYDRFENFDRYGWIVVEKVTKTTYGSYSSAYGIINDKGQTILPCEYSCIRFQDHSDLIMVAKNSNSAGFMNRQLEWVIPPKFQADNWMELESDDFFEYGLVVVSDQNGSDGVFDSTGREILPCRYKSIQIANPNLFIISDWDNRVSGAVNRNGDTVVPFDKQMMYCYYGTPYVEIVRDGKSGVLNAQGKELLLCVFDALNLSSGTTQYRFPCKRGDKWGVVDSLGNIVLPFAYDGKIYTISNMDLFAVRLQPMFDNDNGVALVNLQGKVLASNLSFWMESTSGKSIAALSYQDDYSHLQMDVYDASGQLLDSYDDMKYDEVGDYYGRISMIPVMRNGKWGFVNRDFELIVPCQYEGAFHDWDGYARVETVNGLMLIDERGEKVVEARYDWIYASGVNGWFGALYKKNDDRWEDALRGFIDRYGNSTFSEEELKRLDEWREARLHPSPSVVKSVSENHTPSEVTDSPVEDDDVDPLICYYSETMPEFPGGPDSLNAYLARTILYPQDARDHGVSGTVLAEFVVEKDGHVREVTIKVPLFPSCDEEVTRALLQMPEWKPATNQGLPVRFFMQVPIIFKNDTLYPKLITDTALINTLTAMLRNKSFSQKDYHWLNLEEGDYYRLENLYVVRCMLVGPTGWSSNFQHYLIIDTTKHTDFYFMSLSDAINNVYLNGDLYVNRVSYKDWFNEDADYFHRKEATFKLIRTTLSPADLQIKTETETEKTLRWEEAYGWRFH